MGIKLSPDLPVNAIWYDTVYLPYWSYMTSGGGYPPPMTMMRRTLSVASHAEQAWAKRWEVDGGQQRLCDREHWRLAPARIHSEQYVPPCRL